MKYKIVMHGFPLSTSVKQIELRFCSEKSAQKHINKTYLAKLKFFFEDISFNIQKE